ncbi:hypothetical protein DFP72DRAFT_1065488 [Ephemerocybe angulata]|uniref:Uncharacterized protein n=1 Tax=Ephemerocybe angulata TaxID=980116 RepID=A0A8H6I2G3_9AGAR|nr:hypothetical protein DFP72DRAFT_1065488 [Tulosesus angulatus]
MSTNRTLQHIPQVVLNFWSLGHCRNYLGVNTTMPQRLRLSIRTCDDNSREVIANRSPAATNVGLLKLGLRSSWAYWSLEAKEICSRNKRIKFYYEKCTHPPSARQVDSGLAGSTATSNIEIQMALRTRRPTLGSTMPENPDAAATLVEGEQRAA